jgi:mersacidin/lichenicidin family type 2 lantibiotic
MKKEMIVRAWKDPVFRESLSSEQRAQLPESPSGRPITELDEPDLDSAVGGLPPPTHPIHCHTNVWGHCLKSVHHPTICQSFSHCIA